MSVLLKKNNKSKCDFVLIFYLIEGWSPVYCINFVIIQSLQNRHKFSKFNNKSELLTWPKPEAIPHLDVIAVYLGVIWEAQNLFPKSLATKCDILALASLFDGSQPPPKRPVLLEWRWIPWVGYTWN